MAEWQWSVKSRMRLDTCAEDLRVLMNRVLVRSPLDLTIIEGYRTAERQLELFDEGKTKVTVSRHNAQPSQAVDVAPLTPGQGILWDNPRPWFLLAGVVYSCADELGIQVRWGGDWDSDGDSSDHKFIDLPHWELQ